MRLSFSSSASIICAIESVFSRYAGDRRSEAEGKTCLVVLGAAVHMLVHMAPGAVIQIGRQFRTAATTR